MAYQYDLDLSNDNTSHTKLLKMVESDRQVLEIGCASGYLTRYLKEELNCRVYCVEVDQAAARQATAHAAEMVVGDVEQLDLIQAFSVDRFDIILLADVVEHLKDAGTFLSAIRSLLTPEGFILISVPNGTHGSMALEILDGKWQYRNEGLLDHSHLHFYDKDALGELLDAAGYHISRLQRVIIHPRDSEIKTPWDNYPREVTAYLEKVNPEFQTYQFVVKAFPSTESGLQQGLKDTIHFERERAERAEQTARAEIKAELARRESEYLAGLRREMARLEEEKQEIRTTYETVIAEMKEGHKDVQLDAVHFRRSYRKLAPVCRELKRQIEALTAELAAARTAAQAAEAEREGLNNRLSEEIGLLREEIHRRGEAIGHHQRQAKELSAEIDRLNGIIAELSGRLSNQQTINHRQEERIREIERSRFWRIITRYRLLIEYLCPAGSLRRDAYQLLTGMLALPFRLFKRTVPPQTAPVSTEPRLPDSPAPEIREATAEIIELPTVVNQQPEDPPPEANEPEIPVPADRESPEEDNPPPWHPLEFPVFPEVEVSIIIPVYHQGLMTFNCLESILAHTDTPYEVVLIDNGSNRETAEILTAMKGIKLISNEENRGFVEACNQGAEAASGRNYLFLNNDTQVTPGWLAAMLVPLADERVGLVGAKLVYPDGRLQEAGGIIFQDGGGYNYGNGDDPARPQYNYRKEVDYCSGACLLIRADLWRELGGFDQRYAPAYYEDTDLCFSARAAGYKVVYQPEAEIIHFEGASAGTDLNRGYKRFQGINHGKFLEKWREVLKKDHFSGPEFLYLARERGYRKIILVVDHYAPTYDKDSGSLRMLTLLRLLRELGHKVIFWPANLQYSERYSRRLQRLGIETFYGSCDFESYLEQDGGHLDAIILSRPHVAIDYIYAARRLSRARVYYDTVDLHFLREARRAELEQSAAPDEIREEELFLINQADEVLVVSEIEKELLEEQGFNGKVSLISNIHPAEPIGTPFSRRQGLMFIGGFAHAPNIDGITWFVREILPLIHRKLPGIKLTIVGSNPTPEVLALASDEVTVTGYVEDARPFFAEARIFVCPLRYGAGVKGKIGQSMAHGLPVVMTSPGAEGMGVTDGREAMIADEIDEFAEKVVKLYQDHELWQSLAGAGLELIERRFSPVVIKDALAGLLAKLDSGEGQ